MELHPDKIISLLFLGFMIMIVWMVFLSYQYDWHDMCCRQHGYSLGASFDLFGHWSCSEKTPTYWVHGDMAGNTTDTRYEEVCGT